MGISEENSLTLCRPLETTTNQKRNEDITTKAGVICDYLDT